MIRVLVILTAVLGVISVAATDADAAVVWNNGVSVQSTTNTTVSNTSHNKESALYLEELGLETIQAIHDRAAEHSFIQDWSRRRARIRSEPEHPAG